MRIIECRVTAQKAEITSGLKALSDIVAGSRDYLYIHATFSPEWDDTAIVALFSRARKKEMFESRLNEDGYFAVPSEVIKPPGFVFAFMGAVGSYTITTKPLRVNVCGTVEGESAEPIERSLFEEMIAAFAKEKASAVEEATDEAANIALNAIKELHSYTWYIDTDTVKDASGKSFGTLKSCMTEDFTGTWFYVRTASSEAGSAAYPSSYAIDGANGYLSLRDYVVWTGVHLVHIPTFEAKSSEVKNSDGKYSPKSGVDGLMSSTDKAYLTDLINAYWGKDKVALFTNSPHLCNWCREDGIYVGGFGEDCGGHPPYTGGNKTNWIMFVFNNPSNSVNPNNHRIQIAFDVSNCLMYMRKGWVSSDTWADWVDFSVDLSGYVQKTEHESDYKAMKDYADGLYDESWKNEPVLTIEIAEECAAIDVTEIDGEAFSFERLGGYAELVTNTTNEGRMCIVLNPTTSLRPSEAAHGLVCMNTNGSTTAGNIQKGVFEIKKEFGMWHTADVATSTNTWLDLSSTKHEHWDSRGVFANVDTITSCRLVPYSGVFNAGTVIKIYGKKAKEAIS